LKLHQAYQYVFQKLFDEYTFELILGAKQLIRYSLIKKVCTQ